MRYSIEGKILADIADAINAKTGGTAALAPGDMADEIDSISGGGVTVEPLTVDENGTYTAPSGKAYSPVTVDVDPDEWVRPSDWPDLDSLEIPEDYDCVYLTCDLREVDLRAISYSVTSSSGPYYVERGTLINGVFAADSSAEYASQQTFRIELSEQDGMIQLWRVRTQAGTQITAMTPQNTYGTDSNSYKPQAYVELRAFFHGSVGLSQSNRPFLGSYTKSARLYFLVDCSIAYLCGAAYWMDRLVIEGPGKITCISFAFNGQGNPRLVQNAIGGLDLSHVVEARNPFGEGVAEILDFSATGLNTKNPVSQSYFLYAFNHCRILNFKNTDFGVNMVMNNGYIHEFTPGVMYAASINLSAAYALSKESILRVIDAIPQTTETVTLALGSINQAKLTAEEIAVATEKGWTVA